jgi:hypothetical protein
VIPLSCGAREKFEGYRILVDDLKRGLDGRERQWLVKSESQVLRLAATLTYLNWASSRDVPSGASGLDMISADMEPEAVTELSMADAVKLMREYFWPHARAALRQIGLTDRHKHLRRAMRWIQANRLSVAASAGSCGSSIADAGSKASVPAAERAALCYPYR